MKRLQKTKAADLSLWFSWCPPGLQIWMTLRKSAQYSVNLSHLQVHSLKLVDIKRNSNGTKSMRHQKWFTKLTVKLCLHTNTWVWKTECSQLQSVWSITMLLVNNNCENYLLQYFGGNERVSRAQALRQSSMKTKTPFLPDLSVLSFLYAFSSVHSVGAWGSFIARPENQHFLCAVLTSVSCFEVYDSLWTSKRAHSWGGSPQSVALVGSNRFAIPVQYHIHGWRFGPFEVTCFQEPGLCWVLKRVGLAIQFAATGHSGFSPVSNNLFRLCECALSDQTSLSSWVKKSESFQMLCSCPNSRQDQARSVPSVGKLIMVGCLQRVKACSERFYGF